MTVCQYCNNNFTSNSSLYNHQRKAKYCIEMQKQKNIDVQEINSYLCEWCNKIFNSKYSYTRHTDGCKIKTEKESNSIYIGMKIKLMNQSEELDKFRKLVDDLNVKVEKQNYRVEKLKSRIDEQNEIIEKQNETVEGKNRTIEEQNESIEEYKYKIIDLTARLEERTNNKEEYKELHSKREECIEKIAMQPKNNNTQNTLNSQIINNLPVFNLTAKQLEEAAEEGFSLDLFLQGQVGVAKFTINVARKNHDDELPWLVSDHARGIFKTKDKDGNIIIDRKAQKLTEMVIDALKKKNKEHHDSFYPKRNCDSDDERDEAEIDRAGKIELDDQIRADDCYMDIMKMKRDNSVFVKSLIKESNK